MSAADRHAVAQAARAVVMVRPARFASNPDTRATNRFQNDAAQGNGVARRALAEFDALAAALEAHGVSVHRFAGREDTALPDEVFPNNWISFHADGSVALYPMMAPNRRLERRRDLLDELIRSGAFTITRVIDLRWHERHGRYLEGTGSVVLDHHTGVAYACRSPRTHSEPLAQLCAELGYRSVIFDAADRDGIPVYHTNVLLAIGTRFAVICAEAIRNPAERTRVTNALRDSGRELIEIDFAGLHRFAGNLLELRGTTPLVALSRQALDALDDTTGARLASHGELVAVDVATIERHGGGSVRCMLAELFAPPVDVTQRLGTPSPPQIDW
jgi:hypothetical protein